MNTTTQQPYQERLAALRRLQTRETAEARRILRAVACYYGFTPRQLRRPGRQKDLTEARQVAMYLMRADLRWPTWSRTMPFPLVRIARLLKRDHATVSHGVAQIAARLATNSSLRWALAEIRATLNDEEEQAARAA